MKEKCQEIAITNRHLCSGDFLEKIEEICLKKVDSLILREKDLPPEEYVLLAQKVHALTEKHHLPLIAHYFWREVLPLKIPNIHLPYEIFMADAPELKKHYEKIGVSVHSLAEGQRAEIEGADYVMYGHIFTTDCKKGLVPRGLEALEKLCKHLEIPVYAVGGITKENERQVIEAGALGLCRMSDYMGGKTYE